jgi:hypothetical protein
VNEADAGEPLRESDAVRSLGNLVADEGAEAVRGDCDNVNGRVLLRDAEFVSVVSDPEADTFSSKEDSESEGEADEVLLVADENEKLESFLHSVPEPVN